VRALTVLAALLSLSLQGEGRGEGALLGNTIRGKEIVVGRDANCILCHEIPDAGARVMGNLGPPLGGVGSRLDAEALRIRVVDPTRLNPESIMPSYHRTEGLERVASEFRGKPVLTAQQVEDVVAYLGTLK
jgi:L-cysteine S-thiosulfotransferase